MAITLNWFSAGLSESRTGKGIEGYGICYPFYGSYSTPGVQPQPAYTAIYNPDSPDASGNPVPRQVLGQFADLGSAETACQNHCNGLYP